MAKERAFYVNQFEFGRDEYAALLSMIDAQLKAGRDLAITGHPVKGWTVSIPQNRDRYAGPKVEDSQA